MTDPPRDVLLFGGTFDPPHLGHLAVIRQLRVLTGLPVTVMPTGRPPKRSLPVATARARLEMVRLAVAELSDPQVVVSDLEVLRSGPSYTVDTVEVLGERFPGSKISLAVGADVAIAIGSWHRPEELLSRVKVVVFDRPGTGRSAAEALASLQSHGLPAAGTVLQLNSPRLSASEIRRRLRRGDSCRDALPTTVAEYLMQQTPSPYAAAPSLGR